MDATDRHIQHELDRLNGAARKISLQVAEIDGVLHHALWRLKTMASDLQALRDELAHTQQLIVDDNANDQQAMDVANQKIADLEAQIAAGTPVDTQEFIDTLKAMQGFIKPAV